MNDILQENFKFKINRDNDVYAHHPPTMEALIQIIKERYKELGPGTKQEPIDFNDIDVSRITTFYSESNYIGLFEDSNFEYIDISEWYVSNIKNMRNLFLDSIYLKSVGDLSKWDVSNVEDMRYIFKGCKKLESVGDLSNWDVSNVKDMESMFTCCKNLEFVGDLSNWNISKVENMSCMFDGSGIKKSDRPSWYKFV